VNPSRQELAPSLRLEHNVTACWVLSCRFPEFANLSDVHVYLRGEAYLAAHQGSAAGAEFQKILDHACVVQNEPIGALAHLGLARAYALSGDTVKAKSAYQDFLGLWKDADPDIAILKEAKAEYAKLQ
jgi:eukaryotic-like serine/threonine-protein kinase